MTSNALAEPLSANPLETGPFVLRTLFADVPLSSDGSRDDIKINCVEYLEGNLYVGTSDSELLHFVQIPPDPSDLSGISSFILASRLRPAYAETPGSSPGSRPGVQQILPLPQVGKACVLCNSTATFYSLPELSPVFGNQVKNCGWVGGVDLNRYSADFDPEGPDSVPILLSLNRKIQVVKIGVDARVIKNIDYAGSTISSRRDSIACVADSRSYVLLEIDRQLKIPLMSISSLDEGQPGDLVGHAQSISGSAGGGLLRSNSSSQSRPQAGSPEPQMHRRGTSLGDFITGINRRPELRSSDGEDPSSQQPSPPVPASSPQPLEGGIQGTPEMQKPLPPAPNSNKASPVFLKPLIASPTPEEFLLVTGTGPLEPGIGMFVNLDGDPTRPTIQFDRYPKDIIVDGGVPDASLPSPGGGDEGYVIASTGRDFKDGLHYGLEIQRWDEEATEGEPIKYWLEPPTKPSSEAKRPQQLGIRSLLGSSNAHFQEIIDKLCQKRLRPFSSSITESSAPSLRTVDSRTALSMEMVNKEKELFERDTDSPDESLPDDWESIRNTEEQQFARRLAGTSARVAVWSGNNIWWAMRNPLVLRLDSQLEAARTGGSIAAQRHGLFEVLRTIRGQEATSELEFWTLNYIRQRAGILLMTIFLKHDNSSFSEAETRAMEEVLVDGGLDPRVVLSLVPGVRNEVIETRRGIWIFGGVKTTAEQFILSSKFDKDKASISSLSQPILHFLKGFLFSWRRKKDFGSVPDKVEVFRTVDAALLAILLELDRHTPPGIATGRSIRSELYDLVDNGVDCFDRAETLIESYHRLFILSRLYQSCKMSAEVLATWRRIIEGERDDGDELRDGEQRVREYLSKISNQALVQEYGIWLASRNPKMGVKVFAEDKGRAPKFEPGYVVDLLRQEAPDAVKHYLEYLVFNKGHTIYVNELISYYLDVVISHLESSAEARETMMSTYTSYRALPPPKPTYRQFLTENAPADDDVWHSRLRLLQLLGGKHDYNLTAIRASIARLSATADDLLVPETIILDGREQKHEDALRLLVHRLGDYDTAVAYCLRGGASIYSVYQVSPPGGTHNNQNEIASAIDNNVVEKEKEKAGGSPKDKKATKEGEQEDQDQQRTRLFRALLGEFLCLSSITDRVEQTGLLLDRFGAWFDVGEVLSLIPDSWSVDIVSGFLTGALRRVAVERRESEVGRALSSAQNLKVAHSFILKVEEKGAGGVVEA